MSSKLQTEHLSARRICDSCRAMIVPAGNLPTCLYVRAQTTENRSPIAAIILRASEVSGSFVSDVEILQAHLCNLCADDIASTH